ncbi:MAG: hypothetical protein ACK5GZ_02620 [Cyanobium sp.]|jgi:hypothetical protein
MAEAHADSDLDLAVIVRTAQLTPEEKLECWRRFRQRLGRLGVGIDLVIAGKADVERLSGSRWHVPGWSKACCGSIGNKLSGSRGGNSSLS